ncbi:hypothetical protein SprV_0100201800 [Sparganum proliferum]
MVRHFHDGIMARLTDNGVISEAFAVPSRVKQDCVLAPTLFSLMLSAILMDAYRDERPGVPITYRTDGHLLNSRRMKAITRLSTTTVHDLLFADNCAINATTKEDSAYFCVMSLESVLSPVANRFFKWGEVEVSYVYIGSSVLVIIVSGLMHLMSRCMEDRTLVLLGLFFLTVSYAFLSFVMHNVLTMTKALGATLVVVGVGIHVIGMPFPLAITESLYTKFIPSQQLDKAQTILRTIINVAFLLGPYVGGSLEGTQCSSPAG